MRKLRIGAVITRRGLMTTRPQQIRLPDPASLVHLQFRRYAGCPFCNLHLRSVAQRHQQLVAAGIREVVVFQSPPADLLAQQGDVPFRRRAFCTIAGHARTGVSHEPCRRGSARCERRLRPARSVIGELDCFRTRAGLPTMDAYWFYRVCRRAGARTSCSVSCVRRWGWSPAQPAPVCGVLGRVSGRGREMPGSAQDMATGP